MRNVTFPDEDLDLTDLGGVLEWVQPIDMSQVQDGRVIWWELFLHGSFCMGPIFWRDQTCNLMQIIYMLFFNDVPFDSALFEVGIWWRPLYWGLKRPLNSSLKTIESDGFQMFVFWVLRRYKVYFWDFSTYEIWCFFCSNRSFLLPVRKQRWNCKKHMKF